MFNPSRLWKRLRDRQPDTSDTIEASHQFKALIKTKVWKRIDEWIDRQDEGIRQYMDHEVRVVSIWSLIKAFNLFVKYLMVLHEHRAYKKLRMYIAITIKKGEQYEKQRAKYEERQKRNS